MAKSWKEKFDGWDDGIRDGRVTVVRRDLALLSLSDVPVQLRARLGQLLIRVNLPHKALTAMMPTVRLGAEFREDAPTADKLAYALALIRTGLGSESQDLLQTLPDTCPEKHLYQAYIFQTQWEYTRAVPNIERYLELKSLSDYEAAVAKVNLLACLIQVDRVHEAHQLLDQLNHQATQGNWTLLKRTLLELTAQVAVAEKNWSEARKILVGARDWYKRDDGVLDLFLDKWLAIVNLYESGTESKAEAVLQVRDQANKVEHWETVRDCDRVLAEAGRNQSLFNFTYAGTPYNSFRQKMLRNCSDWATAPRSFTLGNPQGRLLDIRSARFNDGTKGLKAGQLIHRALSALLTDFYRPVSLGKLHAELFPGQYFNPNSSPNKVDNSVYRVRKWIAEQKLPMQITVKSHSFRLVLDGAQLGVHFPSLTGQTQQQSVAMVGNISVIKQAMNDQPFSAKEAAQILQMSKSSVLRLLREGQSAGQIKSEGQGRETIYHWVKAG